MSKTSKTLIFFGNEQLASGIETDAPILRSLIESGYNIPFIVISQKQQKGRRSELAVEKVARSHNIEVVHVSNMGDITVDIKKSGAVIGVLAAFGKIVPESTIDLFKNGIVNIHPSLLPAYRGSTPIESAILDAADTGVSLMSLSAKMDAGPVFAKLPTTLPLNPTKQTAYELLAKAGITALGELLPKIIDGSIRPEPQEHTKATYTPQLTKDVGNIDWQKTASQIEREVRAYSGWPGSKTTINGKSVTITQASVIDKSGVGGEFFLISKGQLGVYCSQQALEIIKLKPAGKPEMTAQAFLAGNKIS